MIKNFFSKRMFFKFGTNFLVSVGIIHVPFKKEPISDAISQFDMNNHPKTTLNYYNREAHVQWGLLS